PDRRWVHEPQADLHLPAARRRSRQAQGDQGPRHRSHVHGDGEGAQDPVTGNSGKIFCNVAMSFSRLTCSQTNIYTLPQRTTQIVGPVEGGFFYEALRGSVAPRTARRATSHGAADDIERASLVLEATRPTN